MVYTDAYIFAWVVNGTSLAYQNVTGFGVLSAKKLYAKSFTV
jgi:hypothetical protein